MAGGKVVMQVWGDMPLSDAIRKTQRYNLDIEEGHNPVSISKRDSTTFASFATDWLTLKTTGLRRKSLIRYKAMVDNFERFLAQRKGKADVPLSEISIEDASSYVQWRAVTPMMPNGRSNLTSAAHQGAAQKTIHSEVATFRQLFSVAVRRMVITTNPFDEVRVKKPKKHEVAAKHHPLTEAEEQALLKAAAEIDAERQYGDGGLHSIFLFMLKTGLREAELRNLEATDVLWEQGLIRIRDKVVVETRTVDIPLSAIPGLKRLITGKSPDSLLFKNEAEMEQFHCVLPIREKATLGIIRVADVNLQARRIVATHRFEWHPKATQGDVPMCKTVFEMLTRLNATRKSNFVFAHKDGGSCRLQLWEMIKEAQKRAGIPGNLRLHDLRHTFAVRLRQRGTPLEVIMGLMRHSDIRETLIYAPYDLAEGRNAIQVLDR